MSRFITLLVCLTFLASLAGCGQNRYQPADWAARRAKLTAGTLPASANSNQGSLPQAAGGSLPRGAQGSLPLSAQGSLPQSAQGSLPAYSGRGSLPR